MDLVQKRSRRKRASLSVLGDAIFKAKEFRQDEVPTPQYTKHEGGEWIDFPRGTRDVTILRQCIPERCYWNPSSGVERGHTQQWLVEILVDGEPFYVHSIKFRNGDVFDAANRGIRRELVLKRELWNLLPEYLLPDWAYQYLGVKKYQRVSRWKTIG